MLASDNGEISILVNEHKIIYIHEIFIFKEIISSSYIPHILYGKL